MLFDHVCKGPDIHSAMHRKMCRPTPWGSVGKVAQSFGAMIDSRKPFRATLALPSGAAPLSALTVSVALFAPIAGVAAPVSSRSP